MPLPNIRILEARMKPSPIEYGCWPDLVFSDGYDKLNTPGFLNEPAVVNKLGRELKAILRCDRTY